MSYCRFAKGESDVYMLMMKTLQCMSCHMIPEPERYGIKGTIVFGTFGEAIEHLKEHMAFGHNVPKSALASLRRDKKEYGNGSLL